MKNAESRPDRVAGPGSSWPGSGYTTGASWRPLAANYYRHHFGCKSCVAAGHGRGDRCAEGLALWLAYETACDLSQPTPIKRNPR